MLLAMPMFPRIVVPETQAHNTIVPRNVLNTIFTRAQENEVFTSFRRSDLSIGEQTKKGIYTWRRFVTGLDTD